MLSDREYIKLSLELNLFFLRIAKEHAVFAAASMTPKGMRQAYQLIETKNHYEELLEEAIELADGTISPEVYGSGELVTELTLPAEAKTQALTGIPVDMRLTRKEADLKPDKNGVQHAGLLENVAGLNRKARALTRDTLAFLGKLYNEVLDCKAFSFTYPAMLGHVAEETEHYLQTLDRLEKRDTLDDAGEVVKYALFWNDIMREHTEFIRGYLDPSEKDLFDQANAYAKEWAALVGKSRMLKEQPERLPEVIRESMAETACLKEFKEQGTEGILGCDIRSVILPLLSDHVTREANHYLRLLRAFYDMSSRDFAPED